VVIAVLLAAVVVVAQLAERQFVWVQLEWAAERSVVMLLPQLLAAGPEQRRQVLERGGEQFADAALEHFAVAVSL
jgi:hypothetical protein